MATSQAEGGSSIEEMWQDASRSFKEMTKKDLKRPVSLDQAFNTLDHILNPITSETSEKKERKDKIKRHAKSILYCIQMLGGLAAQGASLVFGPANMCFNAFQLLLEIPEKISKFYDHLLLLLKEIDTFTKQLQIYKRIDQIQNISMEFKSSVHELLTAFVNICALSIKACGRSTWRAYLTRGKIILFGDDSGVEKALGDFKAIMDRHSRIQDAVSLELVVQSRNETSNSTKMIYDELSAATDRDQRELEKLMQIQTGVAELSKDYKRRDQVQQHRETLRRIKEKFNLERRLPDDENPLSHLKVKALPGSGKWLFDMESYQTWADLDSDAHPLLLLSGEDDSGKSTLLSIVWSQLETEHEALGGDQKRVYIASHVFSKDAKSSGDAESRNSSQVAEALKIMAHQLAVDDEVYAKNLEASLDGKDTSVWKDTDLATLFRDLFSSVTMRDSTKKYFVMLFDGLDQLDEKGPSLLHAVNSNMPLRTRAIFTATGDTFKKVLEATDSIPTVELANHNQTDISKFIENEIAGQKIFRSDDAEVQEILNALREEVPDIAKGNFCHVETLIRTVKDALDSMEDPGLIRKLISTDTLKNSNLAYEQTVETLSKSLSPMEKRLLNELLAWVLSGKYYFHVEQMRAAWYLATEQNLHQDLKDKINSKFHRLLGIRPGYSREEAGFLQFKDPGLEDYFRDRPRLKHDLDGSNDDEPRISMQITIKNVRISQVQRFFWDCSEEMLFEKFSFTDHVSNNDPLSAISASPIDAHLVIAQRCFDLLQRPSDECTRSLDKYATECLFFHLLLRGENAEQSPLELQERQDMVQKLVELLQTPEHLETHFTIHFFKERHLLNDVFILRTIPYYFNDQFATSKLRSKERAWVAKIIADKPAKALHNVAELVAVQWLRRSTWDSGSVFAWLDSYLKLIQYPEFPDNEAVKSSPAPGPSSNEKGETKDDASSQPSPKKTAPDWIERALRWIEMDTDLLVNRSRDALWYERIGDTYRDYSKDNERAKEAYEKAENFGDHSWRVVHNLALCYADLGGDQDLQPALQKIEDFLAKLRAKSALQDDDLNGFVACLSKSAEWHSRLENWDEAVKRLNEAISQSPELYDCHFDLIKVYFCSDRKAEGLEYIEKLNTTQSERQNLTQLEVMIWHLAKRRGSGKALKDFELIFHATKTEQQFQTVLKASEKALESARRKVEDVVPSFEVSTLQLFHGVALAHYCVERNQLERAIRHWKDCIKVGFGSEETEMYIIDDDTEHNALLATRFLINHFITKVQASSAPANDNESITTDLESVMRKGKDNRWYGHRIRRLWASYFRLLGCTEQAEDVHVNDVKTALGLLSDNDPNNDDRGYSMLSDSFLHSGDYLNALSALSLIGPPERYGNPRPNTDAEDALHYYCDGVCNIKWTYSSSIWFCTICDDINFCNECLEKLQNRTLPRLVCNHDHEWIRVPSWRAEFEATGKDRVRVGGSLPQPDGRRLNGHRIGGDIIPISQWLDTIREKWDGKAPKWKKGTKDENAAESHENGTTR